MIDGFDILLTKSAPREVLIDALARAYEIDKGEIDLQYQGVFTASAPERRLFGLVYEGEGGEFPVLVTMSSCDIPTEADTVTIASKISHELGIHGLISSGHPFDDDTRLLIRGFETPEPVIVREEYDEALKETCYFIQTEE